MDKTLEQKIKQIKTYVAKYLEPEEALTPIIIQKSKVTIKKKSEDGSITKYKGTRLWKSNTGEVKIIESDLRYLYYNELTGVQQAFPPTNEEIDRIVYCIPSPNYDYGYQAAYAKYENDMLEIAWLNMPTGKGKEGEPKKWSYDKAMTYPRLFIFRNDPKVYTHRGTEFFPEEMGKYYNKAFIRWLHDLNRRHSATISSIEVAKFFNEELNDCRYPYSWAYKYQKMIQRPISSNQKKIDDITKIQLESIEKFNKLYPLVKSNKPNAYYHDMYSRKDYVHFTKINDEWCVIRVLTRKMDYISDRGYEAEENLKETGRVYIDNKGKVSCTIYNTTTQKWEIAGKAFASTLDYHKYFFGNWEDITQWKQLSWIKPMIEKIFQTNTQHKTNLINLLIFTLRHPIVEKLYKAGYPNLAFYIMLHGPKEIQEIFSVKEKRKGNLYTILNTNKYILKFLDKTASELSIYGSDKMHICQVVRKLFEEEDISKWDEKKVNLYFPPVLAMVNKSRWWEYSMLIYNTPRWRNTNTLNVEARLNIQHVLRMTAKIPEFMDVFQDTINTWKCLHDHNKPRIDDIYKINTLTDMQQLHDMVVNLYNQQVAEDNQRLAEQRAEREQQIAATELEHFNKYQEKRKEKYNYEDDKYIIRVPEQPIEITNEGLALRHCVGGYKSSHCNGYTNIIFLRKKSMPDTPFYTIEAHSGFVCQIHGFGNKYLGNDPDAIPTIVNWIKKLNLSFNRLDILSTSTHYGVGNAPILDGTPYGISNVEGMQSFK